jgi:hypothetical protein
MTVIENPYIEENAKRMESSLSALNTFVETTTAKDAASRKYRIAFEAVCEALDQTIRYTRTIREGGTANASKEFALSRLWYKASDLVAPLDTMLSYQCVMKGMGWGDPLFWKTAEKKGIRIGISDMQDALMKLNRKRAEALKASALPVSLIIGVIFAAVTVLFLMYLLLAGQEIAQPRRIIFDVLIAFCAACSAAFIGSDAAASGRIPYFKDSPIRFSAAGGFGVFVVTFLLLRLS